MKHQYFMMSDFPPWQVYRWTYDSKQEINVIERFEATLGDWVTHDNDLLRGAFMDQQDAGLSTIGSVTNKQAMKLTTDGPV